jgi:hypothetical protein
MSDHETASELAAEEPTSTSDTPEATSNGQPFATHRSHLSAGQMVTALSRHKVLAGASAVAALGLIIYATSSHAASAGGSRAAGTAGAATQHPYPSSSAVTAEPPRGGSPAFPPRTLAGFRTFAATGNASQVQQIGRASLGLASCPTPNIYVTVRPKLGVRPLEADLSAFFLEKGLLRSHCQAFVFAFQSRSDYEAHRNSGYTAGRVALTNDSGSQHNLEVDTGAATSLIYHPGNRFDFSFHSAAR